MQDSNRFVNFKELDVIQSYQWWIGHYRLSLTFSTVFLAKTERKLQISHIRFDSAPWMYFCFFFFVFKSSFKNWINLPPMCFHKKYCRVFFFYTRVLSQAKWNEEGFKWSVWQAIKIQLGMLAIWDGPTDSLPLEHRHLLLFSIASSVLNHSFYSVTFTFLLHEET